MNVRRFAREAVIAAFLFIGLQTVQAVLLETALEKQNQLLAYRLEAAAAGLLEQAHQSKDDLSLYQVIHALGQSPGIIQASIVEPDSKMAPQPKSGIYLFPLKDEGQKWGRLYISLSDRFTHALLKRQWLAGTGAAALVWLVLFFYLQFVGKRITRLQTELTELNGLLLTEKRQLAAIQEREQMSGVRASARLQRAVHLITAPLMVLDHQQRVSAVNRAALSAIGVAQADAIIGKSWQEVPSLESCGVALERSLAFPGQSIGSSVKDKNFQITFETDRDGLAGTWVTF